MKHHSPEQAKSGRVLVEPYRQSGAPTVKPVHAGPSGIAQEAACITEGGFQGTSSPGSRPGSEFALCDPDLALLSLAVAEPSLSVPLSGCDRDPKSRAIICGN